MLTIWKYKSLDKEKNSTTRMIKFIRKEVLFNNSIHTLTRH